MMTTFSNRRNFLRASLAAAAATKLALPQTSTTPTIPPFAAGGILTSGDTSILQFAAAMETIAADIWAQVADMVASNQSYAGGFSTMDPALPQYILDISRDENSHRDFLNAYLHYAQQQGVNLSQFSTLPTYSSIGAAAALPNPYSGYNGNLGLNSSNVPGATGSSSSSGSTGTGSTGTGSTGTGSTGTGSTGSSSTSTGRLTNLSNINLNTSFLFVNRSAYNPDFSFTFPQVMNGVPQSLFGAGATATGGSSSGGAGTVGQTGTTAQTAQSVLLFLSMLESAEGSMYLSLLPKISNTSFLSVIGAIYPVEEMHYTALQTAMAHALANSFCTGSSSSGSGSSTTGTTPTGTTTGTTTSQTFTGCAAGTSFSGSGSLSSSPSNTSTSSSGTGTGTGTGSGSSSGTGGATSPGITSSSFANIIASPTQAESILPAPVFLVPSLPAVSAIRPSSTQLAGAVATVNAMVAANLFQGQSQAFMSLLMSLARAADAAMRTMASSSSTSTSCPTTTGM